MTKQTIIVTGANGQLGSCIREIAPAHKEFDFIFTDVAELDITSRKSVSDFFAEKQPDWVINAAAYTAVDKAETDVETATLLNATAVGILAEESEKYGAGFVHISTDYVFSGTNPLPLSEDEPTSPVSVYGKTKLEGEIEAQKNPDSIIIRTSWLYSFYGNNFVKTMRRLGSEKESISVVADQWGSPTSAHDLADAIITAIKSPKFGLYHFSNEGTTCWADFASEIMRLSGLNCEVHPITTAEYPTPAKRPKFSLLSKDKFKKTFNYEISEWEISLEKVIERLNR